MSSHGGWAAKKACAIALLALAFALIGSAAASSGTVEESSSGSWHFISAASGQCSKAAAREVVGRLGLSLNDPSADPVARVLCGAFTGPGSQTMVVTLAGPTGPLDWIVFRWAGAEWQLLMRQGAGASITAAGSDIRQTQWIYRQGDSRCCPTGGTKSRIWRWNGSRFVAGPWKQGAKSDPDVEAFHTPSRNISCGMADYSSPAPGLHIVSCQSRVPSQKVTMNAAGRLTICRGSFARCKMGDAGDVPTLAYGKQITVGRFRCRSEVTGVTCVVIRSGKGFVINRDGVTRVGP